MHTLSSHRVLLTGANGFIGSHILSQLLSTGLSVRAVVRSQSKIDCLQTCLPPDTSNEHNPHFDFAIVPDITTPDAFNSALQSPLAGHAIDTIIHTASPFLYRNVRNNLEDLLEPAVKGTQEILNAASQAPSVKRIIITSSIAAISSHGLGHDGKIPPGKTYTTEDWNPVTWEEAVSTPDFSIAYRASKKFAEREGAYLLDLIPWFLVFQQHQPVHLIPCFPALHSFLPF
jgi:nucleoside-diphosphate-sugar epimerase